MRYLGIDYGAKRIGLALSDEHGIIAFPYAAVKNLDDVCAVIKKEGVGTVVVGWPLSSTGREGGQAKEVREFAAKLAKKLKLQEAVNRLNLLKSDFNRLTVGIEFENELFTTKIAERHTAKVKTDASAAALILQTYLDKRVKQVK